MSYGACPSCKKEIPSGLVFCPSCGASKADKPDKGSFSGNSSGSPGKRSAPVGLIVVVALASALAALLYQAEKSTPPPSNPAPQAAETPALTPEQINEAARVAKAEERKKRIAQAFQLSGEHWELRQLIRRNLHDPKSYQHIETRYVDDDSDVLEVVTRYRAKNMFGALVINTTLARTHIDGRVIEIVHSQ